MTEDCPPRISPGGLLRFLGLSLPRIMAAGRPHAGDSGHRPRQVDDPDLHDRGDGSSRHLRPQARRPRRDSWRVQADCDAGPRGFSSASTCPAWRRTPISWRSSGRCRTPTRTTSTRPTRSSPDRTRSPAPSSTRSRRGSDYPCYASCPGTTSAPPQRRDPRAA